MGRGPVFVYTTTVWTYTMWIGRARRSHRARGVVQRSSFEVWALICGLPEFAWALHNHPAISNTGVFAPSTVQLWRLLPLPLHIDARTLITNRKRHSTKSGLRTPATKARKATYEVTRRFIGTPSHDVLPFLIAPSFV